MERENNQIIVGPMNKKHVKNASPSNMERNTANKLYYQRFRAKQLKRLFHLETQKKALEAQKDIAGPTIEHAVCQNSLLQAENDLLKQKLSTRSHELESKEAECKELQKERDELKEIYEAMKHLTAEMFIASFQDNTILPFQDNTIDPDFQFDTTNFNDFD